MLSEQRKRRCRNSLKAYIQATTPHYEEARHLDEINDHLEMVERGEVDRLIIVEPPRHGKSLTASQRFPAWYIGRHPKQEIIHGAYGGRLAQTFGRRVRNLMTHQSHLSIFPEVTLAPDSKAADLWHTNQGGVYCAAGVTGPITGFGADLLVIDDPVKGREDADSLIMRDKIYSWYTDDAYTRLMPGGRVVIIGTRWHEDDLIGRLLEDQENGGDQWTVLHHPAINDKGEALWPEQRPLDYLERRKRIIGARGWASLYQGNPNPEGGVYFEKGWIRYGNPPPLSHMRTYGASDYALTDDDGDYTVHLVVGIDQEDRMWLLDVWRKQVQSDQWIDPMLDMMEKYGTIAWAEEKGQITKGIGPFLTKRQSQRKIHGRRLQLARTRDKVVSARSMQARMSGLGLWLPKHAHWAPDLVKELLKFPRGKHDDQVDSLALIGMMLAGMESGEAPKPPPPEPDFSQPNPYHLTLNDLIEEDKQRRGLY